MSNKFGFIGLGLIGGSIAKAVRRFFPDSEIVAYDKNTDCLLQAEKEHVIDVAVSSINDHFRCCSYIFLCAPVGDNTACLDKIIPCIHPALILSDVGSVKTSIHSEIDKMQLSPYFIGGHPMTGSEKSGYENSKVHLLENAYYVLTPSQDVPVEKIERFKYLIAGIKAIPLTMNYKEHDHVTGVISHLPHILASTLVNYVHDHDSDRELMKHLAAGGFKDITRIASSSPEMWRQICLSNREVISSVLSEYIVSLTQFKDNLDQLASEALLRSFSASKDYRESIPNTSLGPIEKTYAIYCDIKDEAGGIAAIATILASGGINIKNIGIINNREYEDGVLRIEFYDESAMSASISLLKKNRYVVHAG